MKTLYNFHKNVYSSELFKDQKGLAEFHCTVQLPYNKPERLLGSPIPTEEISHATETSNNGKPPGKAAFPF